jgi:hypothetical protein
VKKNVDHEVKKGIVKTPISYEDTYCGVASKARSIDRPLLVNGYASSSGFIGNDCKYTQRPTSEHWKHIGGSFPRNGYNRPLPRKSLYE